MSIHQELNLSETTISSYDLNDIIYEDINEEYAYGAYLNFRVVIRKKDRYVNATKLCALGSKRMDHWMENKQAKELMEVCQKSFPGKSGTDVTETIRGGNDQRITGTYVHPNLVPHIASWISPEFGIKISYIVNNFIVNKYQQAVRERDGKISRLEEELILIRKQNDHMLQQNDELLDEVHGLNDKLDVANENIAATLYSLNDVSGRSVPAGRIAEAKQEHLAIICLGTEAKLNYSVIRAQKYSKNSTIKRKLADNPNARVIMDVRCVPNSRELWTAISNKCGRKITKIGNNFGLNGLTEEQFLQTAIKCNIEKYQEYNQVYENVTDEVAMVTDEPDQSEEKGGAPEAEEPIEIEDLTEVNLVVMSVPDLKDVCRAYALRGWSKLRKVGLVAFILKNI
jgi:uncharacterized protein YoxC